MTDDDLLELEQSDLSLLETLDHVLNKGLVIAGEITISVAGVDLIFVGVNLLLGSVETIEQTLGRRDPGCGESNAHEPVPVLPRRGPDSRPGDTGP